MILKEYKRCMVSRRSSPVAISPVLCLELEVGSSQEEKIKLWEFRNLTKYFKMKMNHKNVRLSS